ncbi:hypothetical protein [Mesorhizobium sp. CN2-181]|uniref:hypothetical protein n=1 Tax=Mesorhizobium yinganensis TaxID=3157707 RepID=UPI0032B750E7
MSLLFDAFPKDFCRSREDRLSPRPAGLFRLAIALGLIAALVCCLDLAARQTGDDATGVVAYDAVQQGEVR